MLARRERATREREERVQQALAYLPQAQAKKERQLHTKATAERSKVSSARVSTTDPQVRMMKMPDGRLLAVVRGKALYQTESRDDGYTWSESRQITAEMEFPGDVIKLHDGRLLLTYGRRVPPYGIQGTISRDDAATWDGGQKLFLVADSSTTDCGYPSSLQRDDGTIVTVYYAWDTVAEFDKRRRTGVHGAALLYRPEDLP